jgi:hypothetical protein
VRFILHPNPVQVKCNTHIPLIQGCIALYEMLWSTLPSRLHWGICGAFGGRRAGGATYFPKAMMIPDATKRTRGIRVFPRAGEALLFWNIGLDGREVGGPLSSLSLSGYTVGT